MTTASPTPPAPMTSTPEPGPRPGPVPSAPMTLSTAPTPVITAHPVSAAIRGEVPAGIRTTDSWATTQ